MITAVDSSVIIDVLEPDPDHGPGSREAVRRYLQEGSMVACDVVWAEVATAFGHAQAQNLEALHEIGITYSPMSEEATLRAVLVPLQKAIHKEKAHRFASCDQRLALPKVRDTLAGTAVSRSYVDPDTQ